jgi:hypothetical protein
MSLESQANVAETKEVSPLLKNAIDMHFHCYPEFKSAIKSRLEDKQTLELAREMGMRAVVLKSQMWPTTGQVYYLRQLVHDIECFASITLNPVSGGLNPWVVEAAAKQGAKVVWLPTWSSTHRVGQSGLNKFMKVWFPSIAFEPAIGCIDSSGEVLPQVKSILGLARDSNLVLCTGHISPAESLAIAKEAEKMDFERLVFTHPLSRSVGATLEEAKEMAKRGAYVELLALNVFLDSNLDLVLKFVTEIGPERCILSTDAFMDWIPPGPEYLRMFLGRLLYSGIEEASISTMVKKNPATLLGLQNIEQNAIGELKA